jgi:hypothetical protein
MTIDADRVMRDDYVTEVVTASGDLLTQQDMEGLADEAERGYDLTRAKRVVVASRGAARADEDSQH